jgi:predicted aspartyl protease
MIWIRLSLAIALTASLASGQALETQAMPRWVSSLGYKLSEIFPVSIGRFGYPYLQVMVNRQAIQLPLDTGNMSRLVFSRDEAQRLKLPVTGQTSSYGSNGELRGLRHTFKVAEISALGRTWMDQNATEGDQPDLPGLFGPYYLLDRRFTLDYRRRLLAVSDTAMPATMTKACVKLLPCRNEPGMPVVEGTVNGRKVLIQIDTGKSRTCIDAALARELALPKTSNGWAIAEIRIGEWTCSVMSAREDDFSAIGEGLLAPILLGIGSDVLPQVLMTIDLHTNRLLLVVQQN